MELVVAELDTGVELNATSARRSLVRSSSAARTWVVAVAGGWSAVVTGGASTGRAHSSGRGGTSEWLGQGRRWQAARVGAAPASSSCKIRPATASGGTHRAARAKRANG
jgi:hypothetical protein